MKFIPVFSVREISLDYQAAQADPVPEPIPDTLRPTVTITAPTNGATVSGTVTITATATDNVAIASVRFNIDGVNFGPPIPGPGPYTLPWDTLPYSDGVHEIIAVATDTSGNQRVSAAVDVTILNFPELNGLLWLMPIPFSATTDPADVVATLDADPDTTYDVTLRFRGVVEWKSYSGGTQTGHFVVGGVGAAGGLSSNALRNQYSMEISEPAQVYYLNAYVSGAGDGVFIIDYTATIPMKGNSTVTLKARSEDNLGFSNAGNISVPVTGGDPPILVSQPYQGQFIQMDVVSVIPI